MPNGYVSKYVLRFEILVSGGTLLKEIKMVQTLKYSCKCNQINRALDHVNFVHIQAKLEQENLLRRVKRVR